MAQYSYYFFYHIHLLHSLFQMRSFLIILFLFVSLTLPAQAQITLPDSLPQPLKGYIQHQIDSLLQHTIDSMRPKTEAVILPRRIFKCNIALTGSMNEGNINRKLLAFRSEFSWTGKIFELDLHPRFAFGEQNGKLAEREPYIDALLNVFHKKKVYAFAATNLEASNLRGIDLRWLGGLGAGWHIIQKDKIKLSLTNLVLYEGTDFVNSNDILLWRNSTRLKGQYGLLGNKLTLKHWFYFQPSLNKKNFRWNGIVSLEFPIYKNLQFRFNVEDIYESVVPEGRKNEDRTWTMGISWSRK